MDVHETHSPAETVALGRRLGAELGVGACVAVVGPLGAGKTVFIRGLALGLGVDDERGVCSPTYVLVHEYAGRVAVYHLDLYRLDDAAAELAGLGLEEMLADGVVLIEWADRAAAALPPGRLDVRIEPTEPSARRITVARGD